LLHQVNSKFTAQTFHETFTTLPADPEVLYPSLDFSAFDIDASDIDVGVPPSAKIVFLSINRYERKKNLMLALEAMAELKTTLVAHRNTWDAVHLVLAGGYDSRVAENVEYYDELSQFAEAQELTDHVTFKRSFRWVMSVHRSLPWVGSLSVRALAAHHCNHPPVAFRTPHHSTHGSHTVTKRRLHCSTDAVVCSTPPTTNTLASRHSRQCTAGGR
jgi:glycosyltransferase involved in cell wall biosynthesis